MATVIALIHGEPGNYGISFPDFQGCVAGGDTQDEVLRRGQAALFSHVAAMAADGDAMPPIRSLDAIRADPVFAEDFADAVGVALVEVQLPGKAMRLNITIDERLVERIDRRAKELGESRSAFLARAAKERLAG